MKEYPYNRFPIAVIHLHNVNRLILCPIPYKDTPYPHNPSRLFVKESLDESRGKDTFSILGIYHTNDEALKAKTLYSVNQTVIGDNDETPQEDN